MEHLCQPIRSGLIHTPLPTTNMADQVVVSNFINGEFVPGNAFVPSYDPSTGDVWAQIPDSDEETVNDAVTAAETAFLTWSKTTAEERSRIMMKVADLLEARLHEFAAIESRDQGKPVSLATRVDIPRAVYNFRIYATAILHEKTRSTILEAANAVNYTVRQPVGVAGLISPWNLPLYLMTFKMAPAIAYGNTVVAKPSEMTSVSLFKLCAIFNEAGVPKGVINVVFGVGPRAGEAIVKHPRVPLVSFTGGTVTARKLRIAAAPYSKKLSLELGGKNPAVVFQDADMNKCISTCVRSSFTNQGEICLCTSRIYVERPAYANFVQRFVEETKQLVVGDPRDNASFMGALISKEHLEKVKGYVKLAEAEGCIIECGKEPLNLKPENENGYFMRPTVITNVKRDSRLMKEEIFGPVTCIVPFDNEGEAVSLANDVEYGLAATVWTSNVSRLHRVSHQLQAGTVWANCWMVRDLRMPFGGVKESGIGKEGCVDSAGFYTNERTICVQL